MIKIPIFLKLIPVLLVFLFLASIIKGKSTLDFSEVLAYIILIIAVFSFGLFMVFSLENRRERMSVIKKALRAQDAKIFNLYQLSKYLNPSVVNGTRNQIDQYLISQIDFKIEDINNSSSSLSSLFNFVQKIKPKGPSQEMAREKMLDNLQEISSLLKEISFQVKSRMSNYEWTSLLTLFGIITFVTLHENIGSAISILIISVILSALVLSLLILKELDNLQWQEQEWIWEPLTQLFHELDLIPYFPHELFKENRVSIEKIAGLKEARVAFYKYPYPDFRGKKIRIIKV